MSGPALRQVGAHRAIHESAHGEAEELTEVLVKLADQGDGRARDVVPVLVEHWHTRTLAHAAEEEQGLYLEVEAREPERSALVAALRRDHQLMRQLVGEIEQLQASLETATAEEEAAAVISAIAFRARTLLWMNAWHSQTEEHELLGTEEQRRQ
ncbi:MAG: hemerythrin domain-containing protein [Alicyclobacillus sp.]|nr:hemerythrin domain-containing protein [Alicyclobacillus sp.]